MKKVLTHPATTNKRGRKTGFKLPPPALSPSDTFIRPNQQHFITGFSKSTAYRLEQEGTFPKRRKLSSLAVGWTRAELEEWVASRAVTITPDYKLSTVRGI